MSLTQPTSKMSKSDPNPGSRILITDTPSQIAKKISRALTDSETKSISYDPLTRPGVSNLLEILTILEGESGPEETALGFEGVAMPMKALKERTAEAVARELGDVGERYRELLGRGNGAWLDGVEKQGAERARASAEGTMGRVRDAVGL